MFCGAADFGRQKDYSYTHQIDHHDLPGAMALDHKYPFAICTNICNITY